MPQIYINAFDFDGVVSEGICPGVKDVIITGRPVDEARDVLKFLAESEIVCPVYFQPCVKHRQTRASSGAHKVDTVNRLADGGINIVRFYEDDPEQIEIMRAAKKRGDKGWLGCEIVEIKTDYVDKDKGANI